MEYSGARGKLINEKNQKQKILWHCPFKSHGAYTSDAKLYLIQFPALNFKLISHTTTKIPFMYSFSGNCTASVPISTFMSHVSVSDLYIPRISPHISCTRIGRSIVGITKSRRHINVDCGRAIPFLVIYVSNFWYWFFAVRTLTGYKNDYIFTLMQHRILHKLH